MKNLFVLAVATAVSVFGGLSGRGAVRTVEVRPGDDLSKAIADLRAVRQPGEAAEIVLADGTYVFTNAVSLSKQDQGLVIKAKNQGQATILSGWVFKGSDMKRVKDKRLLGRLQESVRGRCVAIDIPEKIWKRRFENFAAKSWRISELYPIFTVDSEYQRVAHWPNGRERFWWKNETIVKELEHVDKDRDGKENKWKAPVFKVERAEKMNWDLANSDALLFGCLTGWGYEAGSAPIRPVAGEKGLVEIIRPSPNLTRNTYARGVFLNIMEEIDEPGEWSFDTQAKKLVLFPKMPFNENSVCAVGDLDAPFFNINADGVRLEGLVFTAKQAKHAVMIDKCSGVVVAGCRFSGMNAGVWISGTNNKVVSCDFAYMHNNASTLNGGEHQNLAGANNVIENCHFNEFGIMSGGYADAVVVNGCGNTVRNCVMHGALGHAMDLRGAENVVEYCRIYDVCRDHDDSGAVYANGYVSYGSILRYNDVGSSVGMSSGIYLDDFCCGVTVYGNILRNVGHFGVFLSGGRDLTVENNIFTGCWGGIRLDNRGLFWPAWQDKTNFWNGARRHFGVDTNSKFVQKYPRITKWWEKDGPAMINGPVDNVYKNNLFVDDEGLPTSFLVCLSREIPEGRTTFEGNLSVRTKGLEPGKNDMASGDPKKIPDNKHTQKPGPNYTYTRPFEVRVDGKVDGKCERIRVLDGTPENPIDLGFVNLPKGILDLTGFYWDQQGWVNEDALRAKREKGYPQAPYEVGDLTLKPNARLLKEMPGFKPIPFEKIGLYKDQWRTDTTITTNACVAALAEEPWWKVW